MLKLFMLPTEHDESLDPDRAGDQSLPAATTKPEPAVKQERVKPEPIAKEQRQEPSIADEYQPTPEEKEAIKKWVAGIPGMNKESWSAISEWGANEYPGTEWHRVLNLLRKRNEVKSVADLKKEINYVG